MSNDPVLQTRVLAYADTQRYRLGVNYQLLPVNMPKCPFHNNHYDGAMNYTIRDEEACAFPHVFSFTLHSQTSAPQKILRKYTYIAFGLPIQTAPSCMSQ